MSNKIFDFLTKYYTLSKKYASLLILAVFVVLLIAKVSTTICFAVYLGCMVAHIICLTIIQHYLKKQISTMVDDESIKDISNFVGDDNESKDDDTKESD